MIIAVDFDGTIVSDKYPNIGEPNTYIIDYIKIHKLLGTKLILWTCRVGEFLNQAVEWCKEMGIEFDAINDNIPEMKIKYGNNCRKVFADIYLDDKSRNPEGIVKELTKNL